MAAEPRNKEPAEGKTGKIVAALVLVLGVGALVYINLEPAPEVEPEAAAEAVGQGELADCLDRRVGAVENMKADGVLNDAQYASFKMRAETYCEYEFGEASSAPPQPGSSGQ